MKRLGCIVLVIIALCFIIGLVSTDSGETNDANTTEESIRPKKWATWDGEGDPPHANVVVVSGDAVRNEHLPDMGNIYGYAYNRTDKNLSYIQVTYGVYDTNHNKLSSCLANETNISADSGWKFKAICTNLPTTQFIYRVDEVNYW